MKQNIECNLIQIWQFIYSCHLGKFQQTPLSQSLSYTTVLPPGRITQIWVRIKVLGEEDSLPWSCTASSYQVQMDLVCFRCYVQLGRLRLRENMCKSNTRHIGKFVNDGDGGSCPIWSLRLMGDQWDLESSQWWLSFKVFLKDWWNVWGNFSVQFLAGWIPFMKYKERSDIGWDWI